MRVIVHQERRVAPIFFNRIEARDQLLHHGVVNTLRRKRKSMGPTMAREGNLFKFKELGRVDVKLIKKIEECGPELEPYVGESGFKDVEAWCEAAAPGADHLYKVKKL